MRDININKISPNYLILQSVFGTDTVSEDKLVDFFTTPIIDKDTRDLLIDVFIGNKGIEKVADIYFYNKRTLYRYVSKVLVALKEDYEKKEKLKEREKKEKTEKAVVQINIEEIYIKCYNKGEDNYDKKRT